MHRDADAEPPLSRDALRARAEHAIADALNPLLPEITTQLIRAVTEAMRKTPRESEAEVSVPGWGRLKLTGGAVVIIVVLVLAIGVHAYMERESGLAQRSDHAAIEKKYDDLVKEAQTTNYLQSLPPDKRPPLPMPAHLRDLLIKTHGEIPTAR